VIRDITGVTGRQIIRAMVRGERHPPILAAERHEPGATSAEDRATARPGNYRPEPLLALTQALEWDDFYHQQSTACDPEMAQTYAAFQPQIALTAQP
jgi:hypothetical protein